MKSRRLFLLPSCFILSAAALVASFGAAPQEFPARPIRMVIPFPAGGSIDIVGRSIAQRWSAQLGQQIVIDNRAGAAGVIGMQVVAKASPDGYTILYGNAGPLAIGPLLSANVGYDLFRDFEPVSQTTSAPFVIFAVTALPVSNARELIAYARERPGQLNYASSGVGSGLHLMGELFKSVAGVNLVHVPFKGMGQAVPELASGRVQLAVSTVPGVLSQVKAGRLKGIVSSGRERSSMLPDVQTCLEARLPEFCVSSWHAIVAPARTPKPVIARLQRTLAATLANPELREQLRLREDSVAVGSTPGETAKLLRTESERFGRIIREAGIRGE